MNPMHAVFAVGAVALQDSFSVDISIPNFVPINLVDVEIFHWIIKTLTCWWH